MVNPGDFNKRIILQKQTITVDARKQQTQIFTDFARPWANVKTTRSSEAVLSGNLTSLKETRFILRYSKKLQALLDANDTRFRILYKNAKYDVQSVINDDEANITVTIVAIRSDFDGN